MLWIYQLALSSPFLLPNKEFYITKVGAAMADCTTQEHLSLTEKPVVGIAYIFVAKAVVRVAAMVVV